LLRSEGVGPHTANEKGGAACPSGRIAGGEIEPEGDTLSSSGKSFDPATVSRATWIAAGGAVVLFISVFFSWYKVSVSAGAFSVSGSVDGWGHVTTAKFVALFALIAIAALVIEMFVPSVALPLPASLIVIACGVLDFLLVLLKMISHPGGSAVSLAWGIYVSLIAAAVTAYGGYAKMTEG
jgi:hypothetical protein